MLKLLLFLVFIVTISSVACLHGLILGSGQWMVHNVLQCKDFDSKEITFEIGRRKLNRTHDCFNIKMILEIEFNSSFSAEIDIFQEVDGGFKYFQRIQDDCACTFFMKNAEENMKRGFRMAKVDPPDCPLETGTLEAKEFVMDYRELPKHGVYGMFQAYTYLVLNGVRRGCLGVQLNFEKENNDAVGGLF